MEKQMKLLQAKVMLKKAATQTGNGSLRNNQTQQIKKLVQMEKDLEQIRTEVQQLIQNIEPFKPTLDSVNENVDNVIKVAKEFEEDYILEEEPSNKAYSYRTRY